jgi:tetratricopeptide (TPR) repeat protein
VEARDIWREIGGYGEGWALDNLGRVYLALGRIDDAASSLTDAINAHRASGELAGQATTLKHLGHARSAAGDLAAARNSWTEALSIFEQIDERAEAAEVAAALASLPRS